MCGAQRISGSLKRTLRGNSDNLFAEQKTDFGEFKRKSLAIQP
uniref:Uncharacterized protein n=2 Tax=Pasteurellaceae TaxID=712 RepID=A0A6B9L572_GLAPU|nr:hypothetical protein [Glaesserella parasuis]QRX38452.1 hypothetical protein [Actinobacillus sp.]